MGDDFLVVQAQIETVLTLLKATEDAEVRRTYLLEFRVLLDQADKLLLTESKRQQPRIETQS